MPATRAALGFKLHTGWAVVVVASRTHDHIDILLRRRIGLLPPDQSVPRFVYHQAAELPLADASKLVRTTARAAKQAASHAIAAVLDEVRLARVIIDAAGVVIGSTVLPSNLAAILAAHPFIHAAEGALFQNAVTEACEERGWNVVRTRERDLWPKVGEATLGNVTREEVDGLRTLIGPPWSSDHKSATAAALVALGAARTAKVGRENV